MKIEYQKRSVTGLCDLMKLITQFGPNKSGVDNDAEAGPEDGLGQFG